MGPTSSCPESLHCRRPWDPVLAGGLMECPIQTPSSLPHRHAWWGARVQEIDTALPSWASLSSGDRMTNRW